jgi:hypothetical protein
MPHLLGGRAKAMTTVLDDRNDMMTLVEPAAGRGESLEAGMRVAVRRRFDQHWARGFEVVEATEQGYRVRRLSDGIVLPAEFPADEVRRERKRQGMWWY